MNRASCLRTVMYFPKNIHSLFEGFTASPGTTSGLPLVIKAALATSELSLLRGLDPATSQVVL